MFVAVLASIVIFRYLEGVMKFPFLDYVYWFLQNKMMMVKSIYWVALVWYSIDSKSNDDAICVC